MEPTVKVVVMMTRKEKNKIARQARKEGVSLPTYLLRRALECEGVPEELLMELRASTGRAKTALDETLAHIEEYRRNRHRREDKARRNAIIEFQGIGLGI